MTKNLWDFIGAQVWSPTACDCSGYDWEQGIPEYGPHVNWVPDPTGHSWTEDTEAPRLAWRILKCECGWRDLAFNYAEHLSTSARRKVPVYS